MMKAKVAEAFEPSDSINSHVDRMLSVNTESATSSDSGLLSVEENTEADGRGQAGLNPVLQSGLSDIEVNEAVRRYADVLQ